MDGLVEYKIQRAGYWHRIVNLEHDAMETYMSQEAIPRSQRCDFLQPSNQCGALCSVNLDICISST